MNLELTPGANCATYDSGNVTLNNSTWTKVGSINVVGVRGRTIISVNVTGEPLTGLKLTRGAHPASHDDGFTSDVWVDGVPVNDIAAERCITVNPANGAHTAAAGSHVQIDVDATGIAELGVWAKSDGGAARVRGLLQYRGTK